MSWSKTLKDMFSCYGAQIMLLATSGDDSYIQIYFAIYSKFSKFWKLQIEPASDEVNIIITWSRSTEDVFLSSHFTC